MELLEYSRLWAAILQQIEELQGMKEVPWKPGIVY
jgi:hypothetical protein